MRLFKGACVADALLFLFSVYPAYHAFYDRAYRIAKRDLQREEEEDANTYTASW
ncbi:hypothetical protein DIPPA_06706 [Diplonema papillatum]|nr:hypothetical protein DIPPA_06706 [Diplonema papillatum]